MSARPHRSEGSQPWLRLLVWLLVPVALLSLLWFLPKWEMAGHEALQLKDSLELENKIRATWAQIFAGVFVLGGLYFSWRTLVQNTEGQVTDRYYKAVEQLGKAGEENMAIRIGGIYALERIARDSPKDHWMVMEVLCAYVRMHAPAKDCPKAEAKGNAFLLGFSNADRSCVLGPPAPDVQAILTVLGRRDSRRETENERLDLQGTDLRGAQLNGADLRYAQLNDAHLEYASLRGAQLQECSLFRAHLEVASLASARLDHAMLEDACLEWADLVGACLREASFCGAHMQGARLAQSDVAGASFGGANLTAVSLDRMWNASQREFAEASVQLDPASDQLTYLEHVPSLLNTVIERPRREFIKWGKGEFA